MDGADTVPVNYYLSGWMSVTLFGFGVAAIAGAFTFTSLEKILLALGGTFLFIGSLVYFLYDGAVIDATVHRSIVNDLIANEAALVSRHGISDIRVYIPRQSVKDVDRTSVTLFVPQSRDYEIPRDDELESLFVSAENERGGGLSLRPSGLSLFTEFESMLKDELNNSPGSLARQLADGLVEGFELADAVTVKVEDDEGRIRFDVSETIRYGDEQFDTPVSSFLGVGLATGLNRPITVDVEKGGSSNSGYVVTCRVDKKS